MMDAAPLCPSWIAVDWGTSNLRAWAMDADGAPLATRTSAQGMGSVAPAAFEDTLRAAVADWLHGPMTVIACGMVGSRQGWVEAPYATAPCTPACTTVQAPTRKDDLTVHIIAGVKQTDPADVMRGEETQIAGFIALNPHWDGVICLPGTHTKWVHISAGEIVSFRTFMTGELYALLSGASILRHSITDGWDDTAFADALTDAMAKPEALAARLFQIRAMDLLHGRAGGAAKARLSGLLIGAELAAARPYWLGQQVAVIGGRDVAGHYVTALQTQGVPVTTTDATQMTLQGLQAAYKALEAT